jgi:hypothetical protein
MIRQPMAEAAIFPFVGSFSLAMQRRKPSVKIMTKHMLPCGPPSLELENTPPCSTVANGGTNIPRYGAD